MSQTQELLTWRQALLFLPLATVYCWDRISVIAADAPEDYVKYTFNVFTTDMPLVSLEKNISAKDISKDISQGYVEEEI